MNAATDVAIVGLGPAGRALAHRCLRHGLRVSVVDPHPKRRWTPTYACWLDELPSWIAPAVIAQTIAHPAVWANQRRALDRPYCVLDTAALQDSLTLDGADSYAATAVGLDRHTVALSSGDELSAQHVIDARGAAPGPGVAQQTAFGVIVSADRAQPVLDGQQAWFMDWRNDNGASPGDPASFLYAMPLSDRRVLLEETNLVGRPALGLRELQRRLGVRLRNRGLTVDGTEPVERVRIAVEPPPSGPEGVTAFGARAGLMHPGTGYSVAASLQAADRFAQALADGADPHAILWPPRARAVQALRRAGLRSLLGLEPGRTAAFFDAFFALSPAHQRAYLSDRYSLGGTAAAMTALFAALPADLRRTVAFATMRRRIHSPNRRNSTIMVE
ncbi:lycopene cyclase family protein [Skermania sp. ID1734]|uniref:lycopene cyclase family protein n=1 Tax=Skermania sp. ID1734 TaxID=2597516 RepID=UPI00117EB491|nr:lycopene cyclase family protein [Skermania sp. ID1734]TSD95334.1 lycopene cyclase family protein [Skermania sp. ID1734]